MNLEEAAQFSLELAKNKGAQQCDVIGHRSQSESVEIYEGKVKSLEVSGEQGLGIRFLRDGKPGYAYSEKLEKDALETMINDAAEHANLTDKIELELPSETTLPEIDLALYESDIEQITTSDLKRVSLEMESLARETDARIKNIPHLGTSTSRSFVVIANSNGIFFSQQSASIGAGIGVLLEEKESKKMGYFYDAARTAATLNSAEIVNTATERGASLLGASSVSSGKYSILFASHVAAQLLGFFQSSFYAESVQKGLSRLADKRGKKIAPDFFSIQDNPHIKSQPGSHLFDSEGVLTTPLSVVENGVLNLFLYNLESAAKDKTVSTGNGRRGYSGKASTGFSNMIVSAGNKSPEDLLAQMNSGLYITKLEGAAGVSSVSGEISIGAQGFLVENGKKTRPVDSITLSANFFDLLPKISAFSDSYDNAFRSIKVPDMLIAEIDVAG